VFTLDNLSLVRLVKLDALFLPIIILFNGCISVVVGGGLGS